MGDQIKVIGCMDNTMDHTLESANRVYDSDGIAPALNTMQGGNLQPKIVECKCLGGFRDKNSNNNTQHQYHDRVYSMGNVAPCMMTDSGYNYLECKTIDAISCAERGRPTEGGQNVRQLEVGTEVSNALTCNPSNYLALETKSIKIRQATKGGFIDCEVGGGIGLGLSNIPNTPRTSDRERQDMPHSDNGEYP